MDDDDEDGDNDEDYGKGYYEDYYDEDDSVLPALAADPDAFRFSHGLQRSRIFEMPTSHTNRGLQLVQRRLFLLPRSSDSFLRRLAPGVKRTEAEYLYLLEVGRNYGRDYVCIPIRQVGFGTYFRERHPSVVMFKQSERLHLGLTSPHKFLLATTLSRSIPTTTYHLCRSAKPLLQRHLPWNSALARCQPPPFRVCSAISVTESCLRPRYRLGLPSPGHWAGGVCMRVQFCG